MPSPIPAPWFVPGIALDVNSSLAIKGQMPDGATAVSTIIDTPVAYANVSSKLLSIRNNGVEKAYFAWNGSLSVAYVSASAALYAPGCAFTTVGYTTNGSHSCKLTSSIADGAAAVATVIDTTVALANATSKLLSIRNSTVEKLSVDYAGVLTCAAIATTGGGNSIYAGSGGGIFVGSKLLRAAGLVAVEGTPTEGATAVAAVLNSATALSTAGAKIVSIRNAGVEKVHVTPDGGVGIGGIVALPVASVTYRGVIWVVQGGAGVDDVAYMCLKKGADESYSWKQIATGA